MDDVEGLVRESIREAERDLARERNEKSGGLMGGVYGAVWGWWGGAEEEKVVSVCFFVFFSTFPCCLSFLFFLSSYSYFREEVSI